MASLHIAQGLFDIIYPIGSYYETSNASFNPNTDEHWYGTWKEDTAGRVLVAYNTGTFKTVGATGGEETVKLVPDNYVYQNWTIYSNGQNLNFNINAGSNYGIHGETGHNTNTPHNNLQPYVVVKRWHRTA